MYKMILIGDTGAGKTSIKVQYLEKKFHKDYLMTLGADFSVKQIGNNVMQIWDLSGTMVYSKIRGRYYGGANGAIIVFDITRRETFENIPHWIQELQTNTEHKVPIVLVANKMDLHDVDKGHLTELECKNYALELAEWYGFMVPIYFTSARTGFNVDEVFEGMIEILFQMHAT
jgi:small GTP-binding protein